MLFRRETLEDERFFDDTPDIGVDGVLGWMAAHGTSVPLEAGGVTEVPEFVVEALMAVEADDRCVIRQVAGEWEGEFALELPRRVTARVRVKSLQGSRIEQVVVVAVEFGNAGPRVLGRSAVPVNGDPVRMLLQDGFRIVDPLAVHGFAIGVPGCGFTVQPVREDGVTELHLPPTGILKVSVPEPLGETERDGAWVCVEATPRRRGPGFSLDTEILRSSKCVPRSGHLSFRVGLDCDVRVELIARNRSFVSQHVEIEGPTKADRTVCADFEALVPRPTITGNLEMAEAQHDKPICVELCVPSRHHAEGDGVLHVVDKVAVGESGAFTFRPDLTWSGLRGEFFCITRPRWLRWSVDVDKGFLSVMPSESRDGSVDVGGVRLPSGKKKLLAAGVVLDAEGAPVGGAAVRAFDTTGEDWRREHGVRGERTTPDGAFVLRGTPQAENVILTAYKEGMIPTGNVSVPRGPTESVTLRMRQGATIRGRVLVPPGVDPRALRLTVSGPAAHVPGRSGFAGPTELLRVTDGLDRLGRFEISGLGHGRGRLLVSLDPDPAEVSTSCEFELDPRSENGPTDLGDIDARESLKSLEVRVQDEQGEPLVGGSVTVFLGLGEHAGHRDLRVGADGRAVGVTTRDPVTVIATARGSRAAVARNVHDRCVVRLAAVPMTQIHVAAPRVAPHEEDSRFFVVSACWDSDAADPGNDAPEYAGGYPRNLCESSVVLRGGERAVLRVWEPGRFVCRLLEHDLLAPRRDRRIGEEIAVTHVEIDGSGDPVVASFPSRR